MKPDDTYNETGAEVPAKDGNKKSSSDEPVYRVLGESGVVEDEDGNMYSVGEIYGYEELPNPIFPENSHSVSEDKTSPGYWAFYYDPRYCGPSPEEYIEKMVRKYSSPSYQEEKKEEKKEKAPVVTETAREATPAVAESAKDDTPVVTESTKERFVIIPKSVKERADWEQKKADRDGLHPVYHLYVSGRHFCGIENRNNEKVVPDKVYYLGGYYHNGLARVQRRKTRKFGFVDIHGNEVIPCTWRSAGEFSEYMACVQDTNRKCGYVDVTGRLVIPCTWDEGWPFYEGLARVQSDKKIGMIDQSGKLVVPCIWKGMSDFREGLACVMDDNGKCGFIDKTGKVVIPCRWKQAWTFSEGLAVVQDFNKRLGFIDKSGELVIPCRWKKAIFFKNGVARVSDSKSFFLKDKWVCIDKQGRILPDKD